MSRLPCSSPSPNLCIVTGSMAARDAHSRHAWVAAALRLGAIQKRELRAGTGGAGGVELGTRCRDGALCGAAGDGDAARLVVVMERRAAMAIAQAWRGELAAWWALRTS